MTKTPTRFTPEELAKLPKWAQRRIISIQREQIGALERLRERDDEVGTTDIHVSERGMLDAWRPIPTGSSIRYTLGGVDGDDDHEAYVDVAIARGGRSQYVGPGEPATLQVMGGRGLVMQPVSSNVVMLRPETWNERYGRVAARRKA